MPRRIARPFALCSTLALTLSSIAGEPLPLKECGTELLPEQVPLARVAHAMRMAQINPTDAPTPIIRFGIAFHVVRATNGTGGIPQSQIDLAMTQLNAAYVPIGVQFCQVGPTTFIDDSTLQTIDTNASLTTLRSINVQPGLINVYVSGSTQFCGVSAFTFSSQQGIFMNSACFGIASNPSTFPHEVGHYFDLYHTHETAFGTECTDGSNCSVAGDLMCDTAADPNVNGQVNSSCQWTSSAAPACGIPAYSPPLINFMSYSAKLCRTQFTAQQIAAARATAETGRPELFTNVCPGSCYANCDGSTAAPSLTAADFSCFLGKFRANDTYANCDGSTAAPTLTAADFTCFLNKFRAGCP